MNAAADCRLIKIVGLIPGTGGHYDTAVYTYTNNLISKITLSWGMEYIVSYDNGRLSKFEQIYPPTLPYKTVTSFNYNADGTMKSFFRYSTNSIDTSYIIGNVFTYQNGTLNKVYNTGFNNSTNSLEYADDYFFTWSNENIIKLKIVNTFWLPDSSVSLYSYDNKANYLQKIQGGTKYPFVDPYYNILSPGDFTHLLSRNNLIGFPDNPGYIVSYTENQYGLPEAMYWQGDLNVKYFYDCQ